MPIKAGAQSVPRKILQAATAYASAFWVKLRGNDRASTAADVRARMVEMLDQFPGQPDEFPDKTNAEMQRLFLEFTRLMHQYFGTFIPPIEQGQSLNPVTRFAQRWFNITKSYTHNRLAAKYPTPSAFIAPDDWQRDFALLHAQSIIRDALDGFCSSDNEKNNFISELMDNLGFRGRASEWSNLPSQDEINQELISALDRLGVPADQRLSATLAFCEAQKPAPVQLPKKAPALWKDREVYRQSPVEFIRSVYSPWLGKGLLQADINRLDPQLYMAFHNWLRKNDLPADLDLPTRSQAVTREIERAQPENLKRANSLSSSAYYRMRRDLTKTP